MLLATFFETYGLIVIFIALCAVMMIFYFIKHRKQENDIEKFEASLKVGDRIKTYSGFYGEIASITEIKEDKEEVKVVTLKLGNGSFIDVDIRAIGQIDKRDVKQEEQTLESKVAELRMKEDFAKKDLNKANAKPMFRPANLANKEEKPGENVKPAEKPAENAKVENPAPAAKPEVKPAVKPEEANKKEEEKFVPKKFEKREFGNVNANKDNKDGDSKK